MKILKRLSSAIPPVIFSLGVLLTTSFTFPLQEVAPYEYQDYTQVNQLKELERHKKFYLERIERSPDSGLDLAALAAIYVKESNLTGDLSKMDKAEETAKKSLDALPFFNEGPKVTLAQVAESRHRFQESIDRAQEVFEDDSRNKGALTTLVTSYLGYGQPQEALTYAQKLVEVSPGSEAYTLRGLSYLAQGMEAEGISDFNQALDEEGPRERLQSSWIRTLLGRHYFRTSNMEEAEAYTDSALAVLSDYHVAIAQKADIEAIDGNLQEADKLYQKAYKEREEPPYLLARANLKEKMNDPEEAEELRKEAEEAVRLEIETTPYGHYNELAQVLIDRGDPKEREEAIQAAKKDVEQRRTSESYYLLAQAFVNAEKFPEAKNAIQEALKSGEKNCEYQALATEIDSRLSGNPNDSASANCPQFSL